MCIIGASRDGRCVLDVGLLRIVVYESVEDVPKMRTSDGFNRSDKKPVWKREEELAWSNQPLW